MIPKIIHYVWVGDGEKPELFYRCLKTWKKYCPDFQIIEWNNSALKNIGNDYVREAFRAKKWAFVSDYLRLYALYRYGGFYLDTDLEVTQSLDEFLSLSFVTGYEAYEGTYSPLTALMGSEKGNTIIKKLLCSYEGIHFQQDDGQLDLTTNVIRVKKFLKQEFLLTDEDCEKDQLLELTEGSVIYPSHYFCSPQKNKKISLYITLTDLGYQLTPEKLF